MVRLLAGDIGGTSTRLRLVAFEEESYTAPESGLLYEQQYPSADAEHLNLIVKQFLQEANSPLPIAACFAIAGPVKNDTAQVTNLPWELDARQMEADLGIKTIRLINDFAGIGYGIPALQPADLVVLQDRPAVANATIAVLGAGTGLGEALLVWQKKRYEVLATEGGHTDYAPRTDLEIGLLQFLRSRHRRVSVERVVSGQGIFAIYEYLRSIPGASPSPVVEAQILKEDPSAVIAQQALADGDPLCVQALDLFVANYGAEAGNLALKSLPYGGLYLAGGVGTKILPKLQNGLFLEHFLEKGRMRPILESLPVSLITNTNVGLIGAERYAQTLIQPD
ncbi:MAG: glucokinase [Thermosynechococcaceae cyanobacterium MS004]|nr:glucokinase [Thermosynechococcaceae cyanobacterium MS004]